MANTQGMSDEFVESLMTTTTTTTSTTSNTSRSEQQRRRIQERMELPMPPQGRPAARIVRPSPQYQQQQRERERERESQTQDETTSPMTNDNDKEKEKEKNNDNNGDPTLSFPIIGDVVERAPLANSKARPATKKKSRFAQQQQQQQLHGGATSTNGFPSVHVPLGTFVTKPKKAPGRVVPPTPPPTVQTSLKSKSKSTNASSSGSGSSSSGITTESMLEASRRDAHQMLQGMTVDEIQEQQQELKAALSPDLVAFLRQRRRQQNTTTQEGVQTEPSTSTSRPKPKAKAKSQHPSQTGRAEKEHMAQVLSQVQTHQDLDQAYYTVMKEAHPLEKQEVVGVDEESKDEEGLSSQQIMPADDEFALACDLLRSTNTRQTLWASRIVQQHLSQRWKNHQQQQLHHQPLTSYALVRDWPLLLPVSLRCLLDVPLPTTSSPVLHTYVLQSLHLLVLLTAHPDHVLPITEEDSKHTAATFLYQEYGLDDAVPTPRLDTAYAAIPAQPLTVQEDKTPQGQDGGGGVARAPAAAYSTQSSSTSAQADGAAFEKDPMWTLLSKMKSIPRLAQLLLTGARSGGGGSGGTKQQQQYQQQAQWPSEAYLAISGILVMMAQRSPGAASAMAHHDVLLPKLIERILPCIQHQQDEEEEEEGTIQLERSSPPASSATTTSDLGIAMAVLRLLGVLARQSCVTARSLPLSDVLPPLLARRASCDREWKLQRLGLQLWRTTLRYGVHLEALETMTTAATRHWALPYTHPYSLSTDFLAALCGVLECVRLANTKLAGAEDPLNKISKTARSILSMASTYLAATQRQVLLQPTTTVVDVGLEEVDECARYRWNTARLSFLTAYANLSQDMGSSGNNSNTTEEIKIEEWSMEQVLECLEAMDEWTDEGGLVEGAWRRVGPFACISNLDHYQTPKEKDTSLECEAAASAFLQAYSAMLLSLATASTTPGNRMVSELCRSVTKHFVERLLPVLQNTSRDKASSEAEASHGRMPLARKGWINQCHFAVSKVFFHGLSTGTLGSSSGLQLVRMLVFNLLGRLERGQESMAAVLFSQDILFQVSTNPRETSQEDSSWSSSSPISSMFLAELCGSDRARKQLDHSFKLQHGFGITKDGFGGFALDSLLSDADQQPGSSKSPSSGPGSDLALPLGTLWLWQSLSGLIQMKEKTVAHGTNEAGNVVAAVLGLLLELEEGEDLVRESDRSVPGYSAGIPLGAKLYYLVNVCLHAEEVLQDDRVLHAAEAILERYWLRLDQNSILEFSKACMQHTDPSKSKSDEPLDDKEKKLMELFNPEVPNDLALSSEEMRSLEAFLDDMAESYNDYGAQYDFFTKCIRLFLLPIFPSAIRIRTLQELRGILHLLTLPSEMENDSEMEALLTYSLSGGILVGGVIDSKRDTPEILVTMAAVMVPGRTPRPIHGYILAYAVSLMARNLAIALQTGKGVDVMKQRLLPLDSHTIDVICATLSNLVENGGDLSSKKALAAATACSISPYKNGFTSASCLESEEIDQRFQKLKDSLLGKID